MKGRGSLKLVVVLFVLGCSIQLVHSAGPKLIPGSMLPMGYVMSQVMDGDSGKLDLKYPIKDREGDFVTDDDDDNPFDLDDPGIIEKNVEYDLETGQYIITEQIDGRDIKPPVYMTFEEYLEYQSRTNRQEYWRERAKAITLIENPNATPRLTIPTKKGKGKFSDLSIEIRPQGNVDLTFGVNFQKIDNPTLPERQRRQGGFDFDMNINMSVVGKIGDLMKINLDYNTLANFDFENQIKLKYEGEEDDIIKELEAGNVSLPLNTALITGAQSLFGVRSRLQFGRLTATVVYSQQRSQTGNIQIENGSQIQDYEVFADEYDDNRHFFLAHEFRDSYDQALANMPNINSLYQITRIEVWKTNRNSRATQNIRNVVGLMDLGEGKAERIANDGTTPLGGPPQPRNGSNNLYGQISAAQNSRDAATAVSFLENTLGLAGGLDYEKVSAVKLNQSEYTFNPQLGYLSLNQQLNPNEVLAVAYEYTYNGKVYRVGEFAQDVAPDTSDANKIIFLKMLKSTQVRPTLPMWDLMMKNVYSIGGFQIGRENFQLNILYQQPGGGQVRYIPEGSLRGRQLIRVLNLDDLNNQNDPQPDGIFDFVPGITINPQNGRIIFPTVEPFGENLKDALKDAGDGNLAPRYVYQQLYDSIKIVAQQFPELNRFVISGQYESSNSSEISLGAFNIPEGSVVVTAGGNQLSEGIDYQVDYSLGRVRILNQSVLNSGTPINVNFENNALFGFQQKSLFGARLDYRVSDKFYIGHTFMRLKERPFTQKVNIGDDPIRNSIWGFDFNYSTESQFLTWLVDKLPLYETKEPSSFTVSGEMARLNPGHNKAIGDQGVVYIDDFEGTRSSYDLKFPAINWNLASTPRGAVDRNGRVLFPEATEVNELEYGYNRARLSWYNIDPLFLRDNQLTPDNISNNDAEQRGHYTREILQTEVFPNFQNQNNLQNTLVTFDMTYYPRERGPYNYDTGPTTNSAGIQPTGELNDPQSRWGGVTRFIENNNFEEANIEFLEFWVMDPFIYDSNSTGGDLYINLGNISEDVMRDSRFFFENGLPGPNSPNTTDVTAWGNIPKTFPVVNAFDNDPDIRAVQDIGLDGLNDDDEAIKYSDFLADAAAILTSQTALADLQADPSSDNYRYYLNGAYDDANTGIIDRYKVFNNPQGNSPATTGQNLSEAQTNLPNTEDLNRDNTVEENENYFQYRIKMEPDMEVGENYITNIITPNRAGNQAPGDDTRPKWYQFKVPIDEFSNKIGNIQDFKSIRFIRMYLTDFREPVTLRFARLELVRNQWRRYEQTLLQPGEYVPADAFDETFFNVTAVNVEENSEKDPFPYTLPEGIERENSFNNIQNSNALLNEQSLAVQVCDLEDGDSRAVFKNINLDFRVYERLKMFVHAEQVGVNILNDNDLTLFLRIGRDFTENYYEYELPLQVTPLTNAGTTDPSLIWPLENELDVLLDSLVQAKRSRNAENASPLSPYTIIDGKGNKLTVVGNPDIGLVRGVMLGVRNPKRLGSDIRDDGLPKCAEIWFNEMRLVGLDEGGGWAALGRMETQLADLATLVFSARMHTIGFGQLDQGVADRYREDFWQYDAAATIQLGKFFPKKAGLQLPFYAGISQSFSTPQFDPYDLDIKTKDNLDLLVGDEKREYRQQVQTRTTIRSLNLTNVRLTGVSPEKPRFYDPANITMTWAWTQTERSDPLIESDLVSRNKVAFNYNFSPQTKYWTPFKKAIKSSSKWFDIVKDFNFNIMPSNLSFSTEFNRQFGELRLRPIGAEDFPIEPLYNKFFTWDRLYGFKYSPFRSLTFDFTAVNNARIDEPPGRIDTEEKRDSLWTNIKNFGRTTRYTHTASLNYNVPINKIPMFSWTQFRAGYSTSYTWTAGPLFRDPVTNVIGDNPFGNSIANSQDIRLNGELNFKSLYDKAKFLKPYNTSRTKKETKEQREKKIVSNKKRLDKIDKDIQKVKDDITKNKEKLKEVKASDSETKKTEIKALKNSIKQSRQRIKKLKRDKKRVQNPANPALSPLIRPLIALKRVSANYTESRTTFLPGWLPKTRFLGQDEGFDKPGVDFIVGFQPNREKLDEYAANGFITSDTSINYQFTQTINKDLNVRAVVEPFKDFRIDLTLTRQEGSSYSEFFKKASENGNFEHLSAITTGSYSVSFFALKTLFTKPLDNGLSPLFAEFEDLRPAFSQRLGARNPNSDQGFLFVDENGNESRLTEFREGYGPYSQDVLIPAFLAAYTGKSANKQKLNPFKTIPIPNWRLTYNGLHKLGKLDKIFQSVNITHGYSSNMTIGNFLSEISFEGDGYFAPSRIDTLNQNFYSQSRIPTIVLSEQFSPLIGVDITWKFGLTTRFDYKKARNLSMSFVDYRLSETRTTEFTIGMGYRLKGLKLPIKIKGKKVELKNDINFRLDVSFRDNVVTNYQLDQDISEPTSGNKTIRVSPSIDYVINNRLNIRLFFDRNRTIPATSASFPITSTKAGITIRFQLTQ